jgi:hypothetical protein
VRTFIDCRAESRSSRSTRFRWLGKRMLTRKPQNASHVRLATGTLLVGLGAYDLPSRRKISFSLQRSSVGKLRLREISRGNHSMWCRPV